MGTFIEALGVLATPYCLFMMLIGSLIGLILGAIPGLSGALAITIILPLTFAMDSNIAIALLISIWVGSCSGGFIGSVLLGIPGTPSSVATCYDGYAMTKKGEVTRALSAGTVSNFLGTVPSIIIAMIACPIISDWAVKMGPWEYFGLGVLAITLVIGLSRGKMFKGFIAAGIGLLITQVGYSPISSTPRFLFGSYYLAGGFDMVCVLTGIFAGATIMSDYAKGNTGAAGIFTGKIGSFNFSVFKEFGKHIITVIRSFAVGLGIGFLPGMGASLSNVVAYSMAKNASKNPDEFGEGTVEGVIAPEVSNNASVGGAIIPMISLGIPGDGTTALLLGGLTIHGIEAGPLLQTNHPVFVYMIFLSAVFAGIIALLVEMGGVKFFPMILKAPYHYLYPAILVIALTGVYTNTNNMFGVFMSLAFTGLGLWMSYAGIPATPFILAFVLGETLESNFRKAISFARGDWTTFFTRPVSCILILIAIFSVVRPFVMDYLKKRKAQNA
ncbi:MAG TPA: tripartite tricarboxylate transporter permease [Candidatus Avilachnospira avicola]|nr:tripartite tricarboxylate transporter permease [Candidatus Avilachnospira avicola]